MGTKSQERLVIDPLKPFGKPEIARYPSLRAIATPSTGTDHIDLDACEAAGIKVYSLLDDREALSEIRASSEFTFLAILMGLRRIDRVIGSIDRREPGHELYRKLVGIVGLGRNGLNVRKWCTAFGASTIYSDPYVKGFTRSLKTIFKSCDIVVITCSLTTETTNMIRYDLLSRLRENAVLVNTSRGAIINEQDLVRLLQERADVTAVLDVLEGETRGTAKDSPLWFMPNAILTPHIAGHTVESEAKANTIAERLLYTSEDGEKEAR